jgi:hypothetical protein
MYVFHMSLLKHTSIAYVRFRPRLPVDEQIEEAREYGCVQVYVDLGKGRMLMMDARGQSEPFKGDARAEWIKALGVGRDVTAWVARLDVLLRPKAELPTKVRPSRDAATVLSVAASKAHAIVEGATRATSDISTQWQARVSWMMGRASGGTAKDIEKQREYGRKGARKAIADSPVRRWKRKAMRDQFAQAHNIWCNVKKYPTRREARAALPEELRRLSMPTLWRLFKGRT